VQATVILSTYEQPFHLERALRGYARQTVTDFEIVIADDGSGPETARAVDRVRADTALNIRHLWQEDREFRKPQILNRGVVAARSDYVIFSDGDCIPRDDFVQTHIQLNEPGTFLSGGAVRLPRSVSESITVEDVRAGRAADPAWLRGRGWKPGRHRYRLTRDARVAWLLDAATTTRPTLNGNNSSVFKQAVIDANGFDAEMGYFGEDAALGDRLFHLGLRAKMIRHRAPLVHLYHDRPYRTAETIKRNTEIRRRIRKNREVRAHLGIQELSGLDPATELAGEP